MNTTVQKWGNSLALRIPKALAKDIHLQQGSMVDVTVIGGQMVVNPKGKRKYSLARLLKAVTKNARHAQYDWGGAVGRESW